MKLKGLGISKSEFKQMIKDLINNKITDFPDNYKINILNKSNGKGLTGVDKNKFLDARSHMDGRFNTYKDYFYNGTVNYYYNNDSILNI
jgi:hypothetical protein